MPSTRRSFRRLSATVVRSESLKVALFGMAVAAPLAVLVCLIVRDHVDIPYWDQWEFAKLLAKYHDGGLVFGDFWAQHNEHRLLLPRLVMFLLALATGWNIGVELALNVVLATAALVVIGYQLRRTRERVPGLNVGLLFPLIALLQFAFSQAENWLWGWQIAIFLNLLAVVSSIVLVCRRPLTWLRLAFGFVLAVVALYSFGNGALVFGLGVLLPFRSDLDRPTKAAMLAFWAIGSLLAIGAYLYGFVPSENLLPWSLQLVEAPRKFLEFVLVLLGYPMAAGSVSLAVWTGLAGLVWFVVSATYLVRVKRVGLEDMSPYLCFGVYPIASAVLIALGRNGLGLQQAAAPRYIAFGNLLWIADLALLFVALAVTKRPSAVGRGSLVILCVAIVIGAAGSSWEGIRYGDNHRARLAAVRDDILGNGVEHFDLELAIRVYPAPEQIRNMKLLEMMREHRYSLFADRRQGDGTNEVAQPTPSFRH